MSNEKLVFVGNIASSNSLKEVCFRGFLAVENGKIIRTGSTDTYKNLKNFGELAGFRVIQLSSSQVLIPGFVDCHTHAPQFPNIGLGLDRPLLEWLDNYTFPLESQYEDLEFAAEIYDQVVRRLINNGTTTASYFGTIHFEGTLELVRSALKHGQRALVGKVSMNIENSAGYYHDTQRELVEVEQFVETVMGLKSDLVLPVITPRFAVSCDAKLMTGLADIAKRHSCRIQSHISENLKEIEHVLKNNPSCGSYSEVYDKSSILTNKCIMAHAVHLSDSEMALLASRGVSLAHCPASNTRLKSGLCPVRKYLNSKIVVGLGTDVSGGDSASMLDAMRRTMDVSTHLELTGGEAALDWGEAFHLATLGGATALNLDDKIGSFEVGKDFDALLIDIYAEGTIDRFTDMYRNKEDYAERVMQKFIYVGDDRNIKQVYVKGNKIKDLF